MESNFNNRDFEQYVKKNADQYRMIPSERLWKGIHNTLHTRRKWYGIGLASLLLLTAVSVTWVMVSYPDKPGTAGITNQQPKKSAVIAGNDAVNEPRSAIPNLLSLEKFKDLQTPSAGLKPPANEIISFDEVVNSEMFTEDLIDGRQETKISPETVIVAEEKKQTAAPLNFNLNGIPGTVLSGILGQKPAGTNTSARSDKNVVRNTEQLYPLTIESVVNSYKHEPQKITRRLSWQIYITPTVSYRKLRENKSFQSATPFDPVNYPFASLTDINKAVVHKPDMGLELGFATRYPLTKNLKLRGGLQFNINRYDIKAFVYNGEQATINLSGANGGNSVTAWTYYRNYNGYKSDWLKNFYFSVSAPIGAELKLFGNDKTNFGIAGTIQPTYIISDRAYLISTDYKNYAEVPWLIRHLNLNTSFETFISYKTRTARWQVGPQVRYQVMSSFQNKYPVKENLFDFGLKVGITLNQ